MFARSAANDTLQGQAIHKINTYWGGDALNRVGRESIGIPVCKKKYKPFHFYTTKQRDGTVQVEVERLFACKCHNEQRKAVIEKHGPRKGWEPYGQWSLKKAQELAKQETARLNEEGAALSEEEESSTCTDESFCSIGASSCDTKNKSPLCSNGSCLWKVKSAYDDVCKELRGGSKRAASGGNNDCYHYY